MKKPFAAPLLSLSLALSGASAINSAYADDPALPNGASTLQETYGKWSVSCKQEAARQLCRVSQVQVEDKSKKRLFAFELGELSEAKANGMLLLPFGLALGKGVVFQVDDKAAGAPLAFSTCVPAGCLVPLNLDAALLKQLQKGKLLKMNVTPVNSAATTTFTVPLDGFEAAYKRAASLAKG